jgi:hypothetical protein
VEAALTTLPLLAFFFFIVDASFAVFVNAVFVNAVFVKNTLVPRGGAMWRFYSREWKKAGPSLVVEIRRKNPSVLPSTPLPNRRPI